MQPSELFMTGAAVALPSAGISAEMFIPNAPLAACRLCGAIYQTKFHRELHRYRQLGENDPPELLAKVLDLGNKWREGHTKYVHTIKEVEDFVATGWFLTPEAANVLAPFGIFGLGNMHVDIVESMLESSRKPDLTHLEGGE